MDVAAVLRPLVLEEPVGVLPPVAVLLSGGHRRAGGRDRVGAEKSQRLGDDLDLSRLHVPFDHLRESLADELGAGRTLEVLVELDRHRRVLLAEPF